MLPGYSINYQTLYTTKWLATNISKSITQEDWQAQVFCWVPILLQSKYTPILLLPEIPPVALHTLRFTSTFSCASCATHWVKCLSAYFCSLTVHRNTVFCQQQPIKHAVNLSESMSFANATKLAGEVTAPPFKQPLQTSSWTWTSTWPKDQKRSIHQCHRSQTTPQEITHSRKSQVTKTKQNREASGTSLGRVGESQYSSTYTQVPLEVGSDVFSLGKQGYTLKLHLPFSSCLVTISLVTTCKFLSPGWIALKLR